MFEEFVMKKTLLVLFGILLSGCVAERKGEPVVENVKALKCPDAIKVAVQNLEQLGLDKEKLNIWKKTALSMEEQPCSMCQKLIEATYVLKDENDVYKPAMSELMQSVEKTEPNTSLQTQSRKENTKSPPVDDKEESINNLAGQYINAVDTVKVFLISQLHLKVEEANNFTIDRFYVPLMKNEKETQNSNQLPDKSADQKT